MTTFYVHIYENNFYPRGRSRFAKQIQSCFIIVRTLMDGGRETVLDHYVEETAEMPSHSPSFS
jgi:hypothetical protein